MSCDCVKYGLTFLLVCIATCKCLKSPLKNTGPDISPVEVTAVFINCEIDDIRKYNDNENTRFEREELFKHNTLRNCDKKLALTIRLSSASAKSADEYVPIEHVLDGSSKRRVRLLNPYVLRVRRDAPLEAYKLRFIETVSGLLTTSNEQNYKYYSELSKRAVDTADSSILQECRTELVGMVERRRATHAERLPRATFSATSSAGATHGCDHREKGQFNMIAENFAFLPRFFVNRFSLGTSRPPASFPPQRTNSSASNPTKPSSARKDNISDVNTTKRAKRHEKNVVIEEDDSLDGDQGRNREFSAETRFFKATSDNGELSKNELIKEVNKVNSKMDKTLSADKTNGNYRPELKTRSEENFRNAGSGKEFALYEVETPMLWFDVHVHLFEKLITSKGNTLWNDITKGIPVSLNSLSPDWRGSDINLHYKPVDVSREDFFLPKSSLFLLIPLLEENMNTISSNMNYAFDDSNYILVPSEDILDINNVDKSKPALSNFTAEDRNESHRKVVVRVARALRNVMGEKFNVVNQASDKFLTMRHLGISHAQVDLEARADDNQLVHVSAPGRIAIIVAENTRGTRSMLTAQVTNTGLFASRFRVQIRECDSDLIKLAESQDGSVMSEAEVLPPRHTRRLRLRLPAPTADLQHCSVYLLNGNDESVAVRDAVIKKGDQCYCVWHCDCVCYGDNPRLPCQEMSAERQDAAGLPLPPRRGTRFARACLYRDVTSLNVVVVVIGVIGMLLFFGMLKGLLGLLWARAGVWGLDWLLHQPRRLDRYYEGALRGRTVEYDGACWPVHPDTGERTVRVVSLPVEFILNVIFFVAAPGLIAVDTLKHLKNSSMSPAPASRNKGSQSKCSKSKINSRHDVQGRHRRARRLRLRPRGWMAPEADYLSEAIWKQDPTAVGLNLKSMFPLSHDKHPGPLDPAHTSGTDSDLEDTAFVLMHMQKSTESLAKNQIIPKTAGLTTDTEQMTHLLPAAEVKRDLDKA